MYNKFSPWTHLKCFSLGKKHNPFIYSKSSSLASLLEYVSNPKAEKQWEVNFCNFQASLVYVVSFKPCSETLSKEKKKEEKK